MNWIPKLITGFIVLGLLGAKLLSPAASPVREVALDITIVLCLLGPGEQLVAYGWLLLSRTLTKSSIPAKPNKTL